MTDDYRRREGLSPKVEPPGSDRRRGPVGTRPVLARTEVPATSPSRPLGPHQQRVAAMLLEGEVSPRQPASQQGGAAACQLQHPGLLLCLVLCHLAGRPKAAG